MGAPRALHTANPTCVGDCQLWRGGSGAPWDARRSCHRSPTSARRLSRRRVHRRRATRTGIAARCVSKIRIRRQLCSRVPLCRRLSPLPLPADGGPDTSRQYVTRFVRVAYLSAHLRPSRVLSIDRLVDGLAHRTPHDPASLPQRPRIARPLPPSPPIFPHSYSLTRPWRCSQARHATPPQRCPPIVVVTLRAPPICTRGSRTWHAVPSSVARR